MALSVYWQTKGWSALSNLYTEQVMPTHSGYLENKRFSLVSTFLCQHKPGVKKTIDKNMACVVPEYRHRSRIDYVIGYVIG